MLRSSFLFGLVTAFVMASPSEAQLSRAGQSSAGVLGGVGASSPLRVGLPRDGARVGSPSIDVRGRLSGAFAATGAEVLVEGQPAQVFTGPGGARRFAFDNLELSTGSNTIQIVARSASGAVRRESVGVDYVPLTANNVEIVGGYALMARGTAGYAVMNLRTREYQSFPGPTGRVDDVSVADGFLFLLDAQSGGNLSVLSLDDPEAPTLVSGPVSVPVGPFAGVSASGNRVVVSGGTGLLTVRSYDDNGQLSGAVATTDLGIGQPDVLLSEDGNFGYVSTDFAGTVGGAGFGISIIGLNPPPTTPTLLDRVGIPGAGFTGGVQGPANFPIESALLGDGLLTAHGGGLAYIDASGNLASNTGLGLPAVNVDVEGTLALVVGTGRRLIQVDFTNPLTPQVLGTQSFPGPGVFTSVAASVEYLAIAANAGGLRVLRR